MPPSENDPPPSVHDHNRRAWDTLVSRHNPLARPARDEDFRNPLATVDPLGWLGGAIRGKRLLALAAGGGRQSVLYAAAGAEVTVVDISGAMLALDRSVAAGRKLSIKAVQTSMDDLSMFATASFEIVIHPVSTCYVADVAPVFREVARVTAPGGLYISQHKSPISLQIPTEANDGAYRLAEPYYRSGPLPAASGSRLREEGTLEYLHRFEQLLGGICRAGFAIEDFVEPMHAMPDAKQGSFADRSRFVAPYLRVKARRCGDMHSDFGDNGISLWVP